MKILKLKYLPIALVILLQWSCQTESAFSEAVATSKKVPLSDGRPSEADDQYEFTKTQYVHEGKTITDTLFIKELLKNARGLHCDGNKKEIITSEIVAKAFLSKHNNGENQRAALDGDNYLLYVFESTRKYYNDNNNLTHHYFSIIGPKTYNYENNSVQDIYVSRFRATATGTPYLNHEYQMGQAENAINRKVISYLLSDRASTTTASARYICNYTINIYNTTRFKRGVFFIEADGGSGRYIYTILRTGISAEYNGGGLANSFNGLGDFKVGNHVSEIVY